MEDFWNTSDTTPATLDNFFDEESDVAWTGISNSESQISLQDGSCSFTKDKKIASVEGIKSENLPSGSLTSILDNISINSDTGLSDTGNSNGHKLRGVRAIGDKIESWKPPSVSIKWKQSESGSCLDCSSKEEEIIQLKRRLERAYSRHNITLPPQETINRMVLGQPYSLESYKLLEDKLILLDASINAMDASSIVSVIIFLKNTLKKNLFQKELLIRPVAVQVYLTYLKRRCENTEAIELFGALGKCDDALLLRYQLAIEAKKNETVVKNLTSLVNSLKDQHPHEVKMMKQHLNLLELQSPIDASDSVDINNPMLVSHPRATSLFDLPVLTTLFYCSMYHWNAGESSPQSPLYLRKHFDIPDKQFLWTVLKARARVKHWPLPSDLENLMVGKGLMSTLTSLGGLTGGKKVVKTSLPLERVVETLAASGAPSQVLSSYISLIDSNVTKLQLGKKFQCHLAVIESLVSQKDKESLQNYLASLTFGTPEYIKAEQAIKSMR